MRKLNIQHVTYDECHETMSSSKERPSSAARKARNFLSSHLSRQSNEGEKPLLSPTGDRPTTMWPSSNENINAASNEIIEETKSLKPKTEVKSSYLSQQLKAERAKWNQGRLDATPSKPNKCLPLLPKHKENTVNQGSMRPALRRKAGSSHLVNQKLHKNDGDEGQVSPKHKAHIASLQTLQKAIYDGKMEQVASAPATPRIDDPVHAPPRPLKSPFLDPLSSQPLRPQTRRSSRSHDSSRERPKNGKRSSTSTKIASYIGTSADILDETRRDITSKFRPPFEHLNYSSLSHSRRASTASSSSSFHCQGEPEELPYSHPLGPKVDPSLTFKQEWRLSGQGTSPFNDFGPRFCRRCKERGVVGIRGLCNNCEHELAKLGQLNDGSERSDDLYQVSNFGDEREKVKPTPPLKDLRSHISPSNYHETSSTPPPLPPPSPNSPTPSPSPLRALPKPHPKARIHLGNTNIQSKPAISFPNETPRKPSHISQKAEIEHLWDSGSDSDQALAACESAFLAKKVYAGERGGEELKRELRKWGGVYASGRMNVSLEAVGGGREGDESGKRYERSGKSEKRDSSYYGFYEDVLGDYDEEIRETSRRDRMH